MQVADILAMRIADGSRPILQHVSVCRLVQHSKKVINVGHKLGQTSRWSFLASLSLEVYENKPTRPDVIIDCVMMRLRTRDLGMGVQV